MQTILVVLIVIGAGGALAFKLWRCLARGEACPGCGSGCEATGCGGRHCGLDSERESR